MLERRRERGGKIARRKVLVQHRSWPSPGDSETAGLGYPRKVAPARSCRDLATYRFNQSRRSGILQIMPAGEPIMQTFIDKCIWSRRVGPASNSPPCRRLGSCLPFGAHRPRPLGPGLPGDGRSPAFAAHLLRAPAGLFVQHLPFDTWDKLFDFMLNGRAPASRKVRSRPDTG